MKRYRKQLLAGLAGYRVRKIEDADGVWRYAVFDARGKLCYRNGSNQGAAWYMAYNIMQRQIEATGKP